MHAGFSGVSKHRYANKMCPLYKMEKALKASMLVYSQSRADCIYDATTDAQAMVERHDDQTVSITFAGSDSFTDWKLNLRSCWHYFSRIDDRIAKVCAGSGFVAQWHGIRAGVKTHIPDKFQRVVLSGHSLGGAVAMIAALHLAIEGYQDIEVYTFGAPRAFNKRAQSVFKALPAIKCTRFANRWDPVTWLPPGAYHCGLPVTLRGRFGTYSHSLCEYERLVKARCSELEEAV